MELTDEGSEIDWGIPNFHQNQGLPLQMTADRFDDRREYTATFTAFLDQEMREEEVKRNYLKRSDYYILWNPGSGFHAEVTVTGTSDLSCRDQVLVTDPNGVQARMRIVKIDPDALKLSLKFIADPDYFLMSDQVQYTLNFFATQVHLRMKAGLQRFELGENVDAAIADGIIGASMPGVVEEVGEIRVPDSVRLNESQVEAVRFAMKHPIALIQGPPGTGKTTTAAAIVYNFIIRMHQKVLVCAPSNIAVDHLTLSFAQYPDLKPLRIYSRTMLQSEEILLAEKSALHWEARELLARQFPSLSQRIVNKDVDLTTIEEIPQTAIKNIEKKLIEDSHVICCTCTSSMVEYIRNIQFGAVVLDEAGFATEPDSLLPILVGAPRFVLLGDVNQLMPFVQSKAAIALGFRRSMFERLMTIGLPSQLISVQYRMHPDLSKFPNKEVYGSRLTDGVQASDRTVSNLDQFWGNGHPLILYHVTGVEEPAGPWSYQNHQEAVLVEEVLFRLLDRGIAPERVGVITFYEGQRKHITDQIRRKRRVAMDSLEVKNVDGFQGREKDFIVISCVRSNMDSEMGFLHNKNRLNVAITRAKFGLIIIGNKVVLGSDKLWRRLIEYFQSFRQMKNGDEILRNLG